MTDPYNHSSILAATRWRGFSQNDTTSHFERKDETHGRSLESASVADAPRAIPVACTARGIVALRAYSPFWPLVSKPARVVSRPKPVPR